MYESLIYLTNDLVNIKHSYCSATLIFIYKLSLKLYLKFKMYTNKDKKTKIQALILYSGNITFIYVASVILRCLQNVCENQL